MEEAMYATRDLDAKALEALEGQEIVVETMRPGLGGVPTIRPITGVLKRVDDKGIVLRLEQVEDTDQGGPLEVGLYFLPWHSVTTIRMGD